MSQGASLPRRAGEARPWLERPLDLLYFVSLILCIVIALCIDMQAIYPSWLIPSFLSNVVEDYILTSNDPIVSGGLGVNGPILNWVWLRALTIIEGAMQVPLAILSVYYLQKDSPKAFPFVFAFGITVFTSTFPCVVMTSSYPISATQLLNVDGSIASLTAAQKSYLLKLYSPYLIIPFIMMIDMGQRMLAIVDNAGKAEKQKTT